MDLEFVYIMEHAVRGISSACRLNSDWDNCSVCPFKIYCDVLEEAGFGTPDEDKFLDTIQDYLSY